MEKRTPYMLDRRGMLFYNRDYRNGSTPLVLPFTDYIPGGIDLSVTTRNPI